MTTDASDRLRALPSVDALLQTPLGREALQRFQRDYVVESVRAVLAAMRTALQNPSDAKVPPADRLMSAALARMEAGLPLRLRRVINATGVILHTNLGRAGLAKEAIEAAMLAAAEPTNLELDLVEGGRGERDALVRDDLCALTGAAAATVVNNNAAAVLLALNSLAEGREVIVSRGELIEIGGSFRIPEVMAKSGAILREVGTTNRTHLDDYRNAINERTALLLKVHTSNYRIVGFTRAVELAELVGLGRERGLPVMEDLGSGALVDLAALGLPREPVVSERIAAGADLVSFSGDKLLGGPQAGLLVGRSDLIEKINRNPLKRALRCDKMTLAALAATLRLYRTSPTLTQSLPSLRILTRPMAELEAVGGRAVEMLAAALGAAYEIKLVDSAAEIGSGAQPTETLASKAITITHPGIRAHDLAHRFRRADPPIIGRVHDRRFWLDLRAIERAEDLVPGRAHDAVPSP